MRNHSRSFFNRYGCMLLVCVIGALALRPCFTFSALLSPSMLEVLNRANRALNFTAPSSTVFYVEQPPVTKIAWYTPAALQIINTPTPDTFATIRAYATRGASWTDTPTPECIPFEKLNRSYIGREVCAFGYQGGRYHDYGASWVIMFSGHPVYVAARTPFPMEKSACIVVHGKVIDRPDEGLGISANYIGLCR